MTGKTQMKRELDEMTADVLRELEPRERVGLILEASAEGADAWRRKLWDAAPKRNYRQPDIRLVKEYLILREMAHVLVAELWGLALRVRERLAAVEITDILLSSSDNGEAASPGPFGQQAQDAAAELVARWTAWDRFAESELGVSLETWLAGLAGPSYLPFRNIQETLAFLTGELVPEDLAREMAALAGAGPGPDLCEELSLDSDADDPVTRGRRLAAQVLYGAGRVRVDGRGERFPAKEAADVLYERLRAEHGGTLAPPFVGLKGRADPTRV